MIHLDASWFLMHSACLLLGVFGFFRLRTNARYCKVCWDSSARSSWQADGSRQFAMHCSSPRWWNLATSDHSTHLNAPEGQLHSNSTHSLAVAARRCRAMPGGSSSWISWCWEFYNDGPRTLSNHWLHTQLLPPTGESEFAALSSVILPRQKVPFRRWQIDGNKMKRLDKTW